MNDRSSSDDPRVAFFNEQAANWDAHEHGGNGAGFLETHAGLLDFRPGQDLLEVGCGTGSLTAWLAERLAPGRVTAIDFSPEMIARAQAKNIDADFVIADACTDDLSAERFDVVFCFHVFPHLRDQQKAVMTFTNTLKPGGRLLVMHRAGSEQINTFHAGLEGPVHADVLPVGEEWKDLLTPAGLTANNVIDREDLFFLDARKAGASA